MADERRGAPMLHPRECPGETSFNSCSRPLTPEALTVHSALWVEGLTILLGAQAKVQSSRRGQKIFLNLKVRAEDLRRLTGENGKTWRSLITLFQAIGVVHDVEILFSISDPPTSVWAFDVPAPAHRLKVKIIPGGKGCPT